MHTLVDKLNEILRDDVPDAAGGGEPLLSRNNSYMGGPNSFQPPPGVSKLSGKAAGGGDAYDDLLGTTTASLQRTSKKTTGLPPKRADAGLKLPGSNAAAFTRTLPGALTPQGLLTAEEIEKRRKKAEENTNAERAALDYAKLQSKAKKSVESDVPPANAIAPQSVSEIPIGTIVYVRDLGVGANALNALDKYKRGEVTKDVIPSQGGASKVLVTFFTTGKEQLADISRMLYVPQKRGGAYKSKKYRKLPVKKSRRIIKKAGVNKTTIKKGRNMRGGFIANYKTPSSSKGKTKKVKKSSSSGSSKTTTSSKR